MLFLSDEGMHHGITYGITASWPGGAAGLHTASACATEPQSRRLGGADFADGAGADCDGVMCDVTAE